MSVEDSDGIGSGDVGGWISESSEDFLAVVGIAVKSLEVLECQYFQQVRILTCFSKQ